MRENRKGRMSSVLNSLGDDQPGDTPSAVSATDAYVGDIPTSFDNTSTGYTPIGVDPSFANITEGETTAQAQLESQLLSSNPATAAAALQDGIASGAITQQASLPASAWTAADLGKIVQVGAALYKTVGLHNAIGQIQYQPQQINGGMNPMLLLLAAGAAILLLSN